jgi:hypothetical protein
VTVDLATHVERMFAELKEDIRDLKAIVERGNSDLTQRHNACRDHCDKTTSDMSKRMVAVETDQAQSHGMCEGKREGSKALQAVAALMAMVIGALSTLLMVKW